MGKRITQQARGKGSLTFRVRKKAYRYKIRYPSIKTEGVAKVIKLFNSPAHSAPLAKIKTNGETFFSPIANSVFEGQEIYIGKRPENQVPEKGDILKLKDIPSGIKVFNVESSPAKGGKYLRGAGCSGVVMGGDKGKIEIVIKRRKISLNEGCRATVGEAAGDGRLIKPFIKAGKKYHLMKSKGRKWHRTSAVKVNAIDHPFGGGRGKRIKSKIAKRNSSPGQKVGHLRPRRTGKKK